MTAQRTQPPAPTATLPVSPERARRLTIDILQALGATGDTARDQADHLVEGDLRGHASHGLRRLPNIVARIRAGLADPATTGAHEWRTRAALSVRGQRGLGPPVGMSAVEAIAGRAEEEGVALAAISDANHLGMLAPYVERLAARELIGLAWTTSEALVHPWGGSTAMVGTNPIALAVPTGAHPVVLDLATGAISRGKVIDHADRKEPLPEGTVVDAHGHPTTDPEAALAGSISPFGGGKGYALAVGFELLVAALTDSAVGDDVAGTLDATEPCNKGDVLIAFDPRVIAESSRVATLDRFVDQLRATPTVDAGRAGPAAGARARRARAARLAADGEPITARPWADVCRIAAELGIQEEETP
jgi:L-2-hydroxycarboxylate dehydrogenase (NAD+)